jgi:hypothetical protein
MPQSRLWQNRDCDPDSTQLELRFQPL